MKTKRVCLIVAFMVLMLLHSFPAYASGIATPVTLIADDGKSTYLGTLTSNIYDTDSIFNQYGPYGSVLSATSIWNQYGLYGSQLSTWSPFDQYSTLAPFINDGNGNVIGRLTINSNLDGAVNPYTLYATLQSLGI